MGTYSWLTFLTARQQLAARQYDPNNLFWADAENGISIQQALRMFNVLTFTWKTNFAFSSANLWNSLGLIADSPRLRTITDTYCYTDMEYKLLEPPTGGVWTGTTQFSISDLSQALQRRRDEMLQVSNCNQSLMPNIPLTPNTTVTNLPDTVIDVARTRYLPLQTSTTGTALQGVNVVNVASVTGIAIGQLVVGNGIPYPTTVAGVGSASITLSQLTTGPVSGSLGFFTASTLYRDDTVAQEFYEAPLYQQDAGTPTTFSLSSEPPLSWLVDIPPDQAGVYESVVLQSGAAFAPPASTLIGIPDDLAWVLEWGALADLLGRESEATDRDRAAYCLRRYQDGLNLLVKTPWIMLGKVNGEAVSIDSIEATDRYDPEWDSNPNGFGPVIVTGGIDFLAAPVGSGVGVTVLGNAPVPVADGDFVQVSRSDWDIVLDLAQSFNVFKQGGAEWKAALELEARAIQACAAENTRIKSYGCFSDILVQRGQVQERNMERYKTANEKKAQ
jgi:hypothetical protein